MGVSKSKETSSPIFRQFAGAYGGGKGDYTQSSRLAGSLEGVLGNSDFLNPDYGPQTENESNLINSLMDLTAGRGAVRGLGSPTQSGLATALAPTLVDLRNQDIQNRTAVRSQDIAGLLELIGLAMPQVVGGQSSTGRSTGLNIF